MSNSMTFIDNSNDSGDWCVILFNGEVAHEGHEYPRGYAFVKFFKEYNGMAENIKHVQMNDEEILDWRKTLYGDEE